MSTVVETVHDLLVPILDQHHFELVDVEFVKEVVAGIYVSSLINQTALTLKIVP
ncbi:Hypothetical protein LCA_1253 [Latilactobacillus sakei subsp. sakei 23K]|uniref:Ribosome maturation factor RimP n=1 Tax=Latilactobacillus sakei subsp. sakei (strain 23K) TaxID=314315 RepID=Q38W76_LATSS|nr:Hypothetical protein LCA_1253 [Latilactobacillus sakei subsp. sakei 23K]